MTALKSDRAKRLLSDPKAARALSLAVAQMQMGQSVVIQGIDKAGEAFAFRAVIVPKAS